MRISNRKVNKGFTLIELVLVIAILGVLAVAALPSLFNISLTSARTNAMNATVGAIQSGLSLYAANQVVSTGTIGCYAGSALDSAVGSTNADNTNPLFSQILQHGLTSKWKKVATSAATATYSYDLSGDGTANSTGDQCFIYTCTAGSTAGVLVGHTSSGSCP